MEEVPCVAHLGFGDRRLQEPAHAEQLRRNLGTAIEVDSLECAATFENRTSRLPKGAASFRAPCVAPRNLLETADPAHGATVHRSSHAHIGKSAQRAAGNYGFETPVSRLTAGQRRSSLCNSART